MLKKITISKDMFDIRSEESFSVVNRNSNDDSMVESIDTTVFVNT